jgi:hypothetical protein
MVNVRTAQSYVDFVSYKNATPSAIVCEIAASDAKETITIPSFGGIDVGVLNLIRLTNLERSGEREPCHW